MDTKSKLATAKTVTSFVVGFSVRAVIATAVVNLVPTETKAQKAQLFIGTYVVSHMVADHAKTYASDQFDEYVALYRKITKSDKAATETVTSH
jgi:hypothetical protein